jgi:hypothetical protein
MADADTWIEEDAPRRNHGRESTLWVRSHRTRDNARTLVRFPLPTGVPAGCELIGATLRLNATAASTGRVLEAWRVGTAWSELQATWSNQPTVVGERAVASSGRAYREWDVSGSVTGWSATTAHHGFLIKDSAENARGEIEQTYSSRQARNPPQLVLRYGPAD